MPKVYGGLFFENLVAQDKYYDLQCFLLEKGFIDGIQLRVAHPSFTPTMTEDQLPKILSAWKGELFIHYGAENVGVDFGENMDEKRVFAKKGNGISWFEWNAETLRWGFAVAKAAKLRSPWGVIHPGYGAGLDSSDQTARRKIINGIRKIGNCDSITLETIPPVVPRSLCESMYGTVGLSFENYWSFGGTPDDMKSILEDLGSGFKCFIDYTHVIILVNQAKHYSELRYLTGFTDLEKAIQKYLELPHAGICHFSGMPDTLLSSHSSPLQGNIPSVSLRNALIGMEAICLEIPYRDASVQSEINWFREKYLK